MYKHILIPTDGSAVAAKAVEAGIEFAREAHARVTLFTAVPEYQLPGEGQIMARNFVTYTQHERNSEKKAQGVLAPAAERARSRGVECATDYVQNDHPWRAIVEAASRHGCDAIFMGSHGRKGLAGLWYGSETHEVLTHSSIPTVVYR
jgi:nucleotide-binding universal stress UspA family protein